MPSLAVRAIALLLPALTLALPVLAEEVSLHFDPAATAIDFHLGATGHDVNGSFALQRGEIHFDPGGGTAGGELVVDATVAATGNKKRDKAMHNKVLETEVYPVFTFQAERLEGALPTTGKGTVTLHGTLEIHGETHPMALAAEIEIDGDAVHATTAFEIPFVAWGMKDPSMLVLRVKKVVQVTVRSAGTLSGAVAATGA